MNENVKVAPDLEGITFRKYSAKSTNDDDMLVINDENQNLYYLYSKSKKKIVSSLNGYYDMYTYFDNGFILAVKRKGDTYIHLYKDGHEEEPEIRLSIDRI